MGLCPTAGGKESLIIFTPSQIGHHKLKNRLVALPVFTGYAHPDGRVSSLIIEHYTKLAGSGVAMVVVANAAVSSDGIASNNNLRIDRDDLIPGLARLAKAIKEHGALACLQLNHAGRFSITDQPPIPSPIDGKNLVFNVASLKNFMNFFPLEKRFGLTQHFLKQVGSWRHAMTDEERERIIINFGEAASRAHKAGFDMIELHGANGYLLNQFLSAFTNKIQSNFGGGFQGRTTFPLAIIKEVKRQLPQSFPVGFRLIIREWVPDGIDLSEALAFARLLEKEGIGYISGTAGSYNSLFSSEVAKLMSQPGYLREDLSVITRALKVPTIISGRITKPSLANELIEKSASDLIGLGRPLRADIDWVKKAVEKDHGIKICINCNWCIKRVVLGQGLSCRRWSKLLQERTDLEHKMLTRNYKGLWVVADRNDLDRFKYSLPLRSQG